MTGITTKPAITVTCFLALVLASSCNSSRHYAANLLNDNTNPSVTLNESVLTKRKVDVLIIADTYDHASVGTNSIASGVIYNMKFAERIVQDIKKIPGVSVREEVKIDGDRFDCDNIMRETSNFDVQEGDIVFAVYSGHGFHPRDFYRGDPTPEPVNVITDFRKAEPLMPALYCTTKVGDVAAGISSSSIAQSIMRKKPRLIVLIIDSCNKTTAATAAAIAAPEISEEGEDYPAAERLFGRSTGAALFVAASVDQFAWYNPDGGRFTKQFRTILKRFDNDTVVTWTDVAHEVHSMSIVNEGHEYVQTPFSVILRQ